MARIYNGNDFTVKGEGRQSFRYSQNSRSAVLNAERLISEFDKDPDYVLYSNTVKWDDGFEVSAKEQRIVVEAIGEALKHFGIKYVVE